MTSLGIADLLDARVHRASGSSSPSRQVTPGAAAFADVILDASRVSTGDPSATLIGSSTHDAPRDGAPTDTPAAPPLPAAPLATTVLPAPEPSPPSSPDDAVIGVGDTAGADALTSEPAPAGAVPADAGEGTQPVDAPVLTARTDAIGSQTSPTGAAASAAAAESARVVPSAPETLRTRSLAATTTASSIATVAPSPAATTPAAHAATPPVVGAAQTESPSPSQNSVGGRPAIVVAGAGTPAVMPPTVRVAAVETDAAAPDSTPETATAPALVAPAAVPPASAAPAASTGDALLPSAAVGTAPPAQVASVAAPVTVPAARPVLLPQITAPVLSLAQAPDGDHSLTLTVSPENLGPVTVRAHISGGAIHIELHAPNDLGREALRAILADLRRDLAAAAPHASLLLSTSDDGRASSTPQHSANGTSTGSGSGSAANGTAAGAHGGHSGTGTPAGRDADAARAASAAALLADPTSSTDPTSPAPVVSPHGGIDVFA